MLAGVLFLLGVVVALGHHVFGSAYPGLALSPSLSLDTALVLLWLASAIVMLLRLRPAALIPVSGALAATVLGTLACFAAPAVGVVLLLAGLGLGAGVWFGLQLTFASVSPELPPIPPRRAGRSRDF